MQQQKRCFSYKTKKKTRLYHLLPITFRKNFLQSHNNQKINEPLSHKLEGRQFAYENLCLLPTKQKCGFIWLQTIVDRRSQNVLRTLQSFDRAPVPGRRKNKSLLNKSNYGVKATTDSFHVVPTIWLELYSERLKIEPHVHDLRFVCSHFVLDIKVSQALQLQ